MRPYLAGLLLAAAFLLIYLPAIGHGFIKDDFRWIAESRAARPVEALALVERNVGFYRPLVAATFAANYALSGLNAFAYGLTNLALFAIDAGLLFWLAKRLIGVPEAALLAVVAWAFNFHGVNMALLWISGRTALLLCLFSLGTALAAVSGRSLLAGVFALAAMLCKEEAVVLPLLFTVFDRSVRRHWVMWLALGLYVALRLRSGAFGPQDAPSYYQFSFAPATVLRNVFEYLDRGATFAVGIAIALLIGVGMTRPTFSPDERRVLRFAALWFGGFYALTVFLPVRSDLYAVAPSIGAALAVGVLAAATRRVSVRRFEVCCAVIIALIFLLTPVYQQRNQGLIRPAELSTSVLRTLQVTAAGYDGGDLVLVDDPSAPVTLDSTFGNLFSDAVHLTLGPAWEGAISTTEMPARLVFALRDGQLVRR